ncbi:MAG: DUF89 family protein, partial [Anaerolineae bacterium]|nr:DUF89 family protein [Anaerolineae bacterium]NIO00224.1 DUF89 family protein [Anaerolineae bacterium]NIQ83005.1 DUF89 family protein [Anaerolineae bacterium]
KLLPDLPLDNTPAENSTYVLWRAHEILDCHDPFAAKKQHYNDVALSMYPDMMAIVQASDSSLDAAVKVAAAGNIIDLGIVDRADVNLAAILQEVLTEGLAVDEIELLEERLGRASRVLYLVDNAGEIAFDKVLIEELHARGLDVTVVVKGAPILNDATMEDAVAVGIDRTSRVVSNGSAMIGTDLKTCSSEFLRQFEAADLIISKGQANFETLNETPAPIFFILKAKCSEVGRELGGAMGDVVAVLNRRWTDL